MNFAFSEEQDAFRQELRRFVSERWSSGETRRLLDSATGFEPQVWKQMASELGLQGLLIAPEHGGQGFGMLELGIALEELGRQLAGGPFFASAALATTALLNVATPDEQAELLPGLASGETIGCFGFGAEVSQQGAQLTGRAPWLMDAQNADLLLLAVDDALYALEPAARGVSIEAAPGLDLARRFAHLQLDHAPARRLGGAADARAALAKTRHQAVIALSAEQVGAAAQCFEQAVAYVKERMQFGRPVGSFQAVKHRAADAYRELELAKSAAYWAWWVVANDDDELAIAAHMVKSLGSEALRRAAYESIHLHGGYGFTWEHDAHLYYRRASANELLFGDPQKHRAALLHELGLTAAGCARRLTP